MIIQHLFSWSKLVLQLALQLDLQLDPVRVDEEDLSSRRVFFGGINVYLEHKSKLWRTLPRWMTSWVNHPSLIRFATGFAVSNDAAELGELTLDMLDGEAESPDYQIVIEKSKWIRAKRGGFMQFHISPGDIVEKDQPLATNTTLLGDDRNTLHAPFDAVVIGMTSLPAISPGEPLCNLGKLPRGFRAADLRIQRSDEDSLEHRVSEDLASSVMVVDPTE